MGIRFAEPIKPYFLPLFPKWIAAIQLAVVSGAKCFFRIANTQSFSL